MARVLIVMAVALATASSVWAQTPQYPRRPVPFDRKPVERVEVKDQAQVPERPPAKAQPVPAGGAKSM